MSIKLDADYICVQDSQTGYFKTIFFLKMFLFPSLPIAIVLDDRGRANSRWPMLLFDNLFYYDYLSIFRSISMLDQCFTDNVNLFYLFLISGLHLILIYFQRRISIYLSSVYLSRSLSIYLLFIHLLSIYLYYKM